MSNYHKAPRVCIMSLMLVLTSFFLGLAQSAALTPDTKGTVSVPLRHNLGSGRNPHWEYYRTLQKYNISVPERLRTIVQKNVPNKFAAGGGQSLTMRRF